MDPGELERCQLQGNTGRFERLHGSHIRQAVLVLKRQDVQLTLAEFGGGRLSLRRGAVVIAERPADPFPAEAVGDCGLVGAIGRREVDFHHNMPASY